MKARLRYNKSIQTVDQYLAEFPKDMRERLTAMRSVVKKSAPKAEEHISYSIPAYKLEGKRLVYFAGFKNHVSVFALPSTNEAFKKELEPYKTSKGTIQFQNDEPLPLPLIRKIVVARVKELKNK